MLESILGKRRATPVVVSVVSVLSLVMGMGSAVTPVL